MFVPTVGEAGNVNLVTESGGSIPIVPGVPNSLSVVQLFGADPSGNTDALGAFNRGLAASASSPGAGVPALLVPAGTYQLSAAPTRKVRQRIIVAPGVVFTGAGASAMQNLGPQGVAVCPIAQPKIMMLGDSQLSGSNSGGATGMVGYARSLFYQRLRSHRGDFDFTGNLLTLMEETPTPLPFNVCNPGHLIAQCATDLATAIAAVGAPDLLIIWVGGGDIVAGRSLSQMEADWATIEATIAADCPNAEVIVTAIPGFVPGTTTGANYTAWSAQATSFNSWLQTRYQTSQQYIYFSGVAGLGFGEIQYDGAHVNQMGQAQWAIQMATLVDGLIGTRRGPVLPRDFRLRQPWQAVHLTTATSDAVQIPNTATGLNPGNGSFAIGFEFNPTTVDATTRVIAEYGAYNVNPFWALLLVGGHVNFYLNNGGGTIYPGSAPQTSAAMDMIPVLNKWHRMIVIMHAPSASIGVYCNGQLFGLAQNVPAWNFTAQALTLGLAGGTPGVPGFYSRVYTWAGANIPQPGTMAAQLAVEQDYYSGDSLVEGAGTGTWDFNGSLSPSSYGQPAATFVGGAAFATSAYQGGTCPARPWEYQG